MILVVLCLLLLAVTIIDLPAGQKEADVSAQAANTPEPETPDLLEAVKAALEGGGDRWGQDAYQIDHVQIQDDGQVAAVWLAVIDPETGDPLGREPELAMAELDKDGNWQVLLSDEAKFGDVFQDYQYADKSIQGDPDADPEAMPKAGTVYGGYYLPWAAGLTKRLTWSVGHTSCTPTYYCTHAFDFADGTMFPLVAAKGGTVYHWKDTCTNGDSYCTNSITLQDRSTTPWTYQIYLHIAKGSIPSNLKQVGKPVLQGQYIADVDDTGYSTGHHVHFMVVSENTRYLSSNGYIFGMAEDITFRDVSINWHAATQGGRPRLQYEADSYGGQGQTYYLSGNQPAHPPTGALTAPLTKTNVTSPLLTVSGWGQDDIAVTKFEILVNYDGSWVSIGEQTANPFSTSVDLCNTDIPDGPFKLALRVWDYEGNPSSILTERKLIKNIECGATGTDPDVTLTRVDGNVVLPNAGMVSASVTEGSGGSGIVSVEFWFHGKNWNQDNWVKLGVDTNGSNGWQAPFTAGDLSEGNTYTLVAVATDAAGNQGADVTFQAIVDRTAPWVIMNSVQSPVMDNVVTFTWTGGDNLAGLDYYVLAVKINNDDYLTLENYLPGSTTSYQYSITDGQLIVFKLVAYDKSGNIIAEKIAMYTNGYVFPNSYTFPTFFYGD